MDPHFGVAEGFRAPSVMADLRAGWERVVIPWDQAQPTGPGDFSHLGFTVSSAALQSELDRGVHLSAVLQFTPAWAQLDPAAGQRSTPRNLYLPYDDPNNYWAQFVYHTVSHYAGQINEWVIWNEPDIRLSDTGVDGTWTWAGSDEDFAQMQKVAYLAAKQANPNAVVVFPATTYWADELSSPRRPAFYDRVLAIFARDGQSAANNDYHDAVAVNLYRSPDDVYRIHELFNGIQARYGIAKPIWLTEANVAPTDDPLNTCKTGQQGPSSPGATLDHQADYAVQTFALGSAAGYQHMELYDMADDPSCAGSAWGLVRGDGTRRPVADAARTAIQYFSYFTRARFVPLQRGVEHWPAWPLNPGSYIPNWQVYQVVFDRPNGQRVTVLWNGDATPLRVRIPRSGSQAKLVDMRGTSRLLQSQVGGWLVDLPAATAHDAGDPEGYFYVGGEPQLLVEEGVDPSAPVAAPQLVAADHTAPVTVVTH
jgi:hypothetical protein